MDTTTNIGFFFKCENRYLPVEEKQFGCIEHGRKRGCNFCPDCGKPTEKIKTGRTNFEEQFDSDAIVEIMERTTTIYHIENPSTRFVEGVKTMYDVYIIDGHYQWYGKESYESIQCLNFDEIEKERKEVEKETSKEFKILKGLYGKENVKLKFGVVHTID